MLMMYKMNYNRKYLHFFYISILGILINYSTSFAKQVREVTGNDELLFEISQTDLTRLSVENDKISSLQFSNNILDVTQDNKLGEAYIKPKTESPINLFVTTKKGFVYKLLLNPINIPSAQIILRNKNTLISEGISKGASNDYERKLTELVVSIQKDIPLDGCHISNMRQGVQSPIRGIKLRVIQKYACKDFTGYKLEIANKENVSVSEKEFITPKTRAVKLYQSYIIVINKENE